MPNETATTPQRAHQLANRIFEEADPALWRVCYPRRYHEPTCGRYHSPKSLAYELVAITLKMRQPTIGRAEQYEFIAASQLARFNVPMFWLGADMAEAIFNTQPPGEIDFVNMHLPFEACAFMMPRGSLRHPTDGEIQFIFYARLRACEFTKSKLHPPLSYGTENNCFIVLAASDAGILWHWNLPDSAYANLTLPEIEANLREFSTIQSSTTFAVRSNPRMTDADAQLGIAVMHYLIGSVILMEERPDLITRGSLLKRVPAKSHNEVKEFWSPNVLGATYRIRREAPPEGTHASPRLHWVRGFYRQQRHGPHFTLLKRLWIEPYLRGLGE